MYIWVELECCAFFFFFPFLIRYFLFCRGQRFSFGHHYLRPHETFHEPTRKFYPNEVLKVPLYETVPLELIMGRCHVLDPNTYCKGKPIDADPQHVYICEFRCVEIFLNWLPAEKFDWMGAFQKGSVRNGFSSLLRKQIFESWLI